MAQIIEVQFCFLSLMANSIMGNILLKWTRNKNNIEEIVWLKY